MMMTSGISRKRTSYQALVLALSVMFAGFGVGCTEDLAPEEQGTDFVPEPAPGKTDSGWLGVDTYEVNAVVRGRVQHTATGDWADLAGDAVLQADLIDSQLKFIKNTAEANGWRFNQLADSANITAVTVDEDGVTLDYEATVDMLGRYNGYLPTLEELSSRNFSASVPLDPDGYSYTDIGACSESDDGHSAASYNFHYYFAPDKEGCALPLVEAAVEITEVFDRPTVYPEYDQLMQDMGDGRVGFMAALVPNSGDSDPLSRFTAHADMLEDELGLEGVDSEDGMYRRYTWNRGAVRIIIDLYDPTKNSWDTNFAAAFRQRLSEYTLIHYNGHSSYGTKHLLDEPESFSDAYQIIIMHSCQSYAYYTRQVFRAKATEADPSGFALADIVATGKSSYPTGSPPVMRELLTGLMNGLAAVYDGEPHNAPSWLSISASMSDSTWGDIMYGIAGVRTNTWQP